MRGIHYIWGIFNIPCCCCKFIMNNFVSLILLQLIKFVNHTLHSRYAKNLASRSVSCHTDAKQFVYRSGMQVTWMKYWKLILLLVGHISDKLECIGDWRRDKMAALSLAIFTKLFPCVRTVEFWQSILGKFFAKRSVTCKIVIFLPASLNSQCVNLEQKWNIVF